MERSLSEEKRLILEQNWPHWPLLPMRRWKQGPRTHTMEDLELGIMVAPHWHIVIEANLTLIALMDEAERPGYLNTCKTHVYADLDAVLADGWRGD
jgi:hypothetical protein